MKSILLIFVFLIIAGCGGTTPQQVDIPPNSDIRADIAFKEDAGTWKADVVFYFSAPVAPGAKESPPQQTVPVEDPKINNEPLTPATSDTGTPYYTTTAARQARSNVVTARVNGKLYEGITIPGSAIPNKKISVTLSPK